MSSISKFVRLYANSSGGADRSFRCACRRCALRSGDGRRYRNIKTQNASVCQRNNLIAGLSYSANGSEVDTVIIDGKVTMEERRILTMDEVLVYQKIQDIIIKMGLDGKVY